MRIPCGSLHGFALNLFCAILSEMQSRISSSHAGPVKDNTSTSLLLPAIIVSVLLNLTSGWLILSTYMQTPNRRKENPVLEVQLPVYQDREEPEYGEKIQSREDMRDVEDKFVEFLSTGPTC